MTEKSSLLSAVFGADSTGVSPEQRARSSKRQFVRSQHQLSVYHDGAIGRILSPQEALRLFGWDTLKELADRSATPIVSGDDEPYQTIRRQLGQLGVAFSDAARKHRWADESIRRFEQRRQVPFRDLERMAQGIDLDEGRIGTEVDAGADNELSVRLRTLKSSDPKRFTVSTVLGLAEAAWTVRKQFELAMLVNEHDFDVVRELGFRPSDDYGTFNVPAYVAGYRLARETRKMLHLSDEAPIESLKDLVESRLRIPVIQLDLHSDFAGATVASGSQRGIVINLKGDNSDPLARRMTIAHELGHLLWDPDQRLRKLIVDRYDQISRDVASTSYSLDVVERRANAFAIEFLAPGEAIIREFRSAGEGQVGLTKIRSSFGVSRTAIARHLFNSSYNQIDVMEERLPYESFDDWEARESLAVPLFDPLRVPISRRGRFALYVLRALEAHVISEDTAASLYGCEPAELPDALTSTRNYIT